MLAAAALFTCHLCEPTWELAERRQLRISLIDNKNARQSKPSSLACDCAKLSLVHTRAARLLDSILDAFAGEKLAKVSKDLADKLDKSVPAMNDDA